MKVIIKCPKCNTQLNETKELTSTNEAEKLYKDALINPLIGWCKDCDTKGIPEIIEQTPC